MVVLVVQKIDTIREIHASVRI